MRRAGVLALAALLLLALVPATASAKRVRVFAVGPKFSLDWVDSREHFHDKLFALMDRRRRGPDAPVIQRGADDVASHLLGPTDGKRPVQTARDLVTLPEDLGLMSIFTGTRGASARAAPPDTDIVAAIALVLGNYPDLTAYYEARYPELKSRPLPTRALALAATDTFARAAVETYAELADRYDVYLEGGVNMAQSWQVVCVSKASFQTLPGGVGCDEENPGKVAQLRSPDEPGRDYAYEATTDKVSNMALVFDPDGRLISKQIKTYLTPTEAPNALDLVPGELSRGLTALRTPVGTLGFATSKDAFMPDVVQRMDQRHVDLLVQPEFFVGDTVRTTDDAGKPRMWSPDNLKAAGYSDVLRHPSIESLVLPELTGNVFTFSADAQQHIVTKPRSLRGPRGFLVGQPAAPGFVAVQNWLIGDPASSAEAFPARRARLGAAGEKALPRSSNPPCPDPAVAGPCRNGQVEGVIFHDVEVDRRPRLRRQPRRRHGATPFSVNRPIAPSRYPQRNVALATRGRATWAAFEERRGARDQIFLVRSGDGGAHWSRPSRPVRRRAGSANEWWPSLSVGPDGRVWMAWVDDSFGVLSAYYASSGNGGRTFSRPIAVDRSGPPGVFQWRATIAATGRGSAVVAFLDERERSADDANPQSHVYSARVTPGGPRGATRLDQGTPVTLADRFDDSWAPRVVARGRRVLVTWIDDRTYDWDVYARSSVDGGSTFSPEKPVNDAPGDTTDGGPPNHEALDDSPHPALTDRGPLVAFTDYRKRESSSRFAHPLYDIDVAAPGQRNRQVDSHDGAQIETFSPSIVPMPRGGALVAWQDHARGPGDILIAPVRADRGGGRPRRVDDTGRTGSNQWRPELALAGGRVLAAWEDDRDGPTQIFAARAPASKLR